jgi:hypothetical protein
MSSPNIIALPIDVVDTVFKFSTIKDAVQLMSTCKVLFNSPEIQRIIQCLTMNVLKMAAHNVEFYYLLAWKHSEISKYLRPEYTFLRTEWAQILNRLNNLKIRCIGVQCLVSIKSEKTYHDVKAFYEDMGCMIAQCNRTLMLMY